VEISDLIHFVPNSKDEGVMIHSFERKELKRNSKREHNNAKNFNIFVQLNLSEGEKEIE
jgi:hypothetical protein